MKVTNKTQALILLAILIAIGGVVMYGKKPIPKATLQNTPNIKGPTMPPPGYATPR